MQSLKLFIITCLFKISLSQIKGEERITFWAAHQLRKKVIKQKENIALQIVINKLYEKAFIYL